nr:hybrid sensor histidine kinase/response regulator [Pseudomonadota bacterium]
LLDNSAKYSDEQSCIRVSAHIENERVHVSIEDQGIGLAPQQLEHVFEMFEQGGRSGEFAGGLGLGLAIVRNLVAHHGGRVWAESQGRGHGSSFHVELPLVEDGIVGNASDSIVADEVNAGVSVRVMVVDDNVDALTTLSLVLQLYGCEVLQLSSPIEALNCAKTFAPHLAVLDIGMPEMDGMTLARHLRTALGDVTPKLVALTGFGQVADRQRAVEAGFDDFLVKPVDPVVLEKMIQELQA